MAWELAGDPPQWESLGNIKGPPGPAGPRGEQGEPGDPNALDLVDLVTLYEAVLN